MQQSCASCAYARQPVGYALHPENRTLQPVQRRFLGLFDMRGKPV
ncbi:MAG: hypothetical protein WC091_19640 [Sulfuricellaceae bacterium]